MWKFALYHLVGLILILEIDWLSKNYATIDCNKREILVSRENSLRVDQVFLLGDVSIESCMYYILCESNKVSEIRKGFLSSVVEAQLKSKELDTSSVRIDFEYLDVFSKELLGLPPAGEMEFYNDLLPVTTTISKATYKMAPAELQKLKG